MQISEIPVHLESFQDTFLHEICGLLCGIYSNLKYRIQIYTERTERSSIPHWNVQFDKCEINIKENLPGVYTPGNLTPLNTLNMR